jgi:hypothetical protein|tara:strand:+ start:138 stop:341 length:204 start_codon:yes stop_codon:yes gene_type:complete
VVVLVDITQLSIPELLLVVTLEEIKGEGSQLGESILLVMVAVVAVVVLATQDQVLIQEAPGAIALLL